jgi:hypothetical protein
MSDNSESWTIQHFKRVVPRPEVLLFTREEKKTTSKEHVDLRDMFQ